MTRFAAPIDPARLRTVLAMVAHARTEAAAVAYFDPEWRLLAFRHAAGRRTALLLPVGTLVHEAIGLRAVRMVLAHGHPSGDPRPSGDDLAYTRALARTLETVGVTLHDHLVFGGVAMTSFRDEGRL